MMGKSSSKEAEGQGGRIEVNQSRDSSEKGENGGKARNSVEGTKDSGGKRKLQVVEGNLSPGQCSSEDLSDGEIQNCSANSSKGKKDEGSKKVPLETFIFEVLEKKGLKLSKGSSRDELQPGSSDTRTPIAIDVFCEVINVLKSSRELEKQHLTGDQGHQSSNGKIHSTETGNKVTLVSNAKTLRIQEDGDAASELSADVVSQTRRPSERYEVRTNPLTVDTLSVSHSVETCDNRLTVVRSDDTTHVVVGPSIQAAGLENPSSSNEPVGPPLAINPSSTSPPTESRVPSEISGSIGLSQTSELRISSSTPESYATQESTSPSNGVDESQPPNTDMVSKNNNVPLAVESGTISSTSHNNFPTSTNVDGDNAPCPMEVDSENSNLEPLGHPNNLASSIDAHSGPASNFLEMDVDVKPNNPQIIMPSISPTSTESNISTPMLQPNNSAASNENVSDVQESSRNRPHSHVPESTSKVSENIRTKRQNPNTSTASRKRMKLGDVTEDETPSTDLNSNNIEGESNVNASQSDPITHEASTNTESISQTEACERCAKRARRNQKSSNSTVDGPPGNNDEESHESDDSDKDTPIIRIRSDIFEDDDLTAQEIRDKKVAADMNALLAEAVRKTKENLKELKRLAKVCSRPGERAVKKMEVVSLAKDHTFKLYEFLETADIGVRLKNPFIPKSTNTNRSNLSIEDVAVEDLAGYFRALLDLSLLSREPTLSQRLAGVVAIMMTRLIRLLGGVMVNGKQTAKSEQMFTNACQVVLKDPYLIEKHGDSRRMANHLTTMWQVIRNTRRGVSYVDGAKMDHANIGVKGFLEKVRRYREAHGKEVLIPKTSTICNVGSSTASQPSTSAPSSPRGPIQNNSLNIPNTHQQRTLDKTVLTSEQNSQSTTADSAGQQISPSGTAQPQQQPPQSSNLRMHAVINNIQNPQQTSSVQLSNPQFSQQNNNCNATIQQQVSLHYTQPQPQQNLQNHYGGRTMTSGLQFQTPTIQQQQQQQQIRQNGMQAPRIRQPIQQNQLIRQPLGHVQTRQPIQQIQPVGHPAMPFQHVRQPDSQSQQYQQQIQNHQNQHHLQNQQQSIHAQQSQQHFQNQQNRPPIPTPQNRQPIPTPQNRQPTSTPQNRPATAMRAALRQSVQQGQLTRLSPAQNHLMQNPNTYAQQSVQQQLFPARMPSGSTEQDHLQYIGGLQEYQRQQMQNARNAQPPQNTHAQASSIRQSSTINHMPQVMSRSQGLNQQYPVNQQMQASAQANGNQSQSARHINSNNISQQPSQVLRPGYSQVRPQMMMSNHALPQGPFYAQQRLRSHPQLISSNSSIQGNPRSSSTVTSGNSISPNAFSNQATGTPHGRFQINQVQSSGNPHGSQNQNAFHLSGRQVSPGSSHISTENTLVSGASSTGTICLAALLAPGPSGVNAARAAVRTDSIDSTRMPQNTNSATGLSLGSTFNDVSNIAGINPDNFDNYYA